MRVTEAEDNIVGIVITGAVVPAVPVPLDIPLRLRSAGGVGTELHQPERSHGAGEDMAAPAGADQRANGAQAACFGGVPNAVAGLLGCRSQRICKEPPERERPRRSRGSFQKFTPPEAQRNR